MESILSHLVQLEALRALEVRIIGRGDWKTVDLEWVRAINWEEFEAQNPRDEFLRVLPERPLWYSRIMVALLASLGADFIDFF